MCSEHPTHAADTLCMHVVSEKDIQLVITMPPPDHDI